MGKCGKYFVWGGVAVLLAALALCVVRAARQESPPAWECPLTVMYEDTRYVRSGTEELQSLDGLEQVGTVESSVSSTQLPEENYQTNVEPLLGQTIWEKDGLLYIRPREEQTYWVFTPEDAGR